MAHRPGTSQSTLQRRLKRQRSKVQNQVELSRVLGITCYNDHSLCIGKNAECVVYPSGCAVILYHPKTNTQSHVVNPSRKPISSLCLSPDNKFLAFGECGHNPCVHVWDISTSPYAAVHQLSKHSYGISCVAFSPNMRYLVSVGYHHDQTIHVWNWRANATVATNKITSKVCGLDFSADGTYFVTVGNRRVRYWYFDTTGKDGKLNAAHPLKGHSAILKEHQNNCFVTVACGRGVSSNHTYTLTKSGLLCLFNNQRHLQKWISVKGGVAHCLLASDEHVICGCSDGTIKLFHPMTLDFIVALPKPHPLGVNLATPSEASSNLGTAADSQYPDTTALSFDSSTNMLAVVYNDHSLYLWDISSTDEIEKAYSSLYHNACIWDVCPCPICPDECGPGHTHPLSFVTCSSDNTVRFWQISQQGNIETTTNAYSKDTFHIMYTDSDTSFLKDTSVTPGDASAVHDSRRGVRCLQLHPRGLHLAIGDRIGNLRVYQLDKLYNELVRVEAHDAEVLSLDYSPTSAKHPLLLATSSRDRLVHVFHVDQNYAHLQTLYDHSAAVTAVKFAVSKGNLVLLSCGVDKSVVFNTYVNSGSDSWSFQRSQHIACKSSLYAMTLDPTMKQLAVVGQDKIVRVFSVATGKLQTNFSGNASEEAAYLINLALDPSGTYVAISGSDKAVCVFDLRSGDCLAKLYGHSEIVTTMSFSPDCRLLFSVSGDSCLFVWKLSKDLVQNMHSRLIELGLGPLLSRMERSTQLRRETYSVSDDGRSLPTETIDGEDGANFRFSISKLPTWARNQLPPNPATSEGDCTQPTDSRQAGGKWAESTVSPTALFGEVHVGNSPGSVESEPKGEKIVPELVLEASKDRTASDPGGDLVVIDLTEEEEVVEDVSGDSELAVISGIEGCEEEAGDSSPENGKTDVVQIAEANFSPTVLYSQADSGLSSVITPDKQDKDVLDGVEDIGASPTCSSSSSSTPDSVQKENPEQDAFLKANFVSLSAEKVDHFFEHPQDETALARFRRISLSARFFSRSLRKAQAISPLSPPNYPPSPVQPDLVTVGAGAVDVAERPGQQNQTEDVGNQKTPSSTAVDEICSPPAPRTSASLEQEDKGETLSTVVSRPRSKSQKSSESLEVEVSIARKRLEELGYQVPSKPPLLGKALSQANNDQTPTPTPADEEQPAEEQPIEEEPVTTSSPFVVEDIVTRDESLSGHNQHLLRAQALVEHISSALFELQQAVEKVMETKEEWEGKEEEDSLSTLAQAVQDLKEQCSDVTGLLPGTKKSSSDDVDMNSLLAHYSDLLVQLVQEKIPKF